MTPVREPPKPQNLPDKIRAQMNKLGFPAQASRESVGWLMGKYQTLHMGTNSVMKAGTMNWSKLVGRPEMGKMYFFAYDAKHKATLPFWDRFPLILPVEPAENGFYGLNLHYLPPLGRLNLLTKMETILNNDKYDNNTKFQLSYQMLKNTSKFSEFRNCFKRYLKDHIVSSFLYIPPNEWHLSIFLPAERFVKKTKYQVWNY